MIIWVYGEDAFRLRAKVRQLREAFEKKFDTVGMNVSVFPASAEGIDAHEVLQAVMSLPFLSEKRLVIVRDLLASIKKPDANFLERWARIPDSTIFIVQETGETNVVEKHPLFLASTAAHHYAFPILQGAARDRWVREEIASRGGSIQPDVLRLFVETVDGDSWTTHQEIEKMLACAQGGVITRAIVSELVNVNAQGNIFALMDAISQKNKALVMQLLESQRAFGSEEGYLFHMLARQARLLLCVRSLLDDRVSVTASDVAHELKIPPFVAGKTLSQARAYTRATCEHLHDRVFESDRQIKTGVIGPRLAVDLLVAEWLKN